jgi:hypothetical protein
LGQSFLIWFLLGGWGLFLRLCVFLFFCAVVVVVVGFDGFWWDEQ